MSGGADLSRVSALSRKGRELVLKGHNARAAEKFGLAVAEAQKALHAPDCLVVAALRGHLFDALVGHATWSAEVPADAVAVLQEACLQLLPAFTQALLRRKAAGTLLPGACRPAEEAWHEAQQRHEVLQDLLLPSGAEEYAAVVAPYVGVGTYFNAGASAAYVMRNFSVLNGALQLSEEQAAKYIDATCSFVTSALHLMVLPRQGAANAYMPGEPELVRLVRLILPTVRGKDDPLFRELNDAWRRVLRSGVLRARDIEDGIEDLHKHQLRRSADAEASFAACRLRRCALAGCEVPEAHEAQFKRCAACRAVCYCCKEHQVADWPAHKAACKAARKAAAADAGSAGPKEQ